MHREWFTASARDLARRIRAGEVSSAQLVEAHIERIQTVNPVLNALVADRFDAARVEAVQADQAVAAADDKEALPPLLGVPCTIKESFALTDMPHSAGVVARRDVRAKVDAPPVARLRSSGAIPLGVTNTSELCMWMESNNRLYGRTNNPYDPSRIVGGSSGGEGAIVGAGASPFGLGSDIGGSIRMPAFFNGVFGHKPSGGLVPNTGQYPAPENEARRYNCTGPLCRHAEDLMPLLRIMAGPDGVDDEVVDRELGNPDSISVEGMPVLVVQGNGRIPVANDLLDAQARVANWLEAQGAIVERVQIPGLADDRDIWASMLQAAGGKTFRDLMGEGKSGPFRPGPELVRWLIRRTDHTLPAIMLTLTEKLFGMRPAFTAKMVERGNALRQEMVDRIGDGILLYPPYPLPAPKHYHPLRLAFHWVYTAIWNVLELPVTQVPLGLNSSGVPLGVQVVGGPFADHRTIHVAEQLDHAFGGWVFPERLTEIHSA